MVFACPSWNDGLGVAVLVFLFEYGVYWGLTACVTGRIPQSEAAGHPVRVNTFVRHRHQEYRILCGQTIDETNTQEKSSSPKTKNLALAAVTWVFRTFGNLVRWPRVVSRHAALCLPR